jgi:hypothetical protein
MAGSFARKIVRACVSTPAQLVETFFLCSLLLAQLETFLGLDSLLKLCSYNFFLSFWLEARLKKFLGL